MKRRGNVTQTDQIIDAAVVAMASETMTVGEICAAITVCKVRDTVGKALSVAEARGLMHSDVEPREGAPTKGGLLKVFTLTGDGLYRRRRLLVKEAASGLVKIITPCRLVDTCFERREISPTNTFSALRQNIAITVMGPRDPIGGEHAPV